MVFEFLFWKTITLLHQPSLFILFFWLQYCDDQQDYLLNLHQGVAGLRIAFSPGLGYADVEPEVAALVKKADHNSYIFFHQIYVEVPLISRQIEYGDGYYLMSHILAM